MSDKTKTKAELLEMLAEAVRNTQPPPVRKHATRSGPRRAARVEAQNATPQNATRAETHGQNQKRSGIC